METIVEYGMASANNHQELLHFVSDGIAKGYQPYGAPFTTVQYEI